MMIPEMEKFLSEHQDHFVKMADSVAVLLKDHNVAHAKLLLSQYKYNRVPVIDKDKNFVGVLGLGEIVEFEMGQDFFYDKLLETKIEEIMNSEVSTLQEDFTIEEVLHELVNEPFLPVLSGTKFKGIIVRQELLKSVNAMVHDFTKEYEITKRNP
ncbi:cyclic-di-AMP-binding protein CbpB [Lactovum miscens]|uniref:CBS domain-containing protein n=1 Tax=Lactovum miscens TaxID=190387 RepID=A0A841C7W8_9LACT|nr:cyclic-di-AMP-binding protein CbpB [Lactovum miscens]MBB5888444.1 CBS domain-containing protein [Lactovum miscens]